MVERRREFALLHHRIVNLLPRKMRATATGTLRIAATKATPALFPVPRWEPISGFTVDRALLYAVMRQESGFNPNAVSGMGAMSRMLGRLVLGGLGERGRL